MPISSDVLATLEKLERGACSDAEATLSEWIDIGEDLEGQIVIGLVRSAISRAADGKDGIRIREPAEYSAALELVKNSALRKIFEYDSSSNILSISGNIPADDARRLLEHMIQFGITID
jgi:hypothetical protein